MSPNDVSKVISRRNTWWDRSSLTPALVRDVWCPALQRLPLEIALEALTRYAKAQRHNNPPTLEDLLTHCEDVEEEHHRAAVQARRTVEDQLAMVAWHKAEAALEAERRLQPVVDPVMQVLQEAAHDPWVHGHVLMHEKGVNRPGREQDAAAFCWQQAEDDAPNHDAWMAEGAWYAGGARGPVAWSTAMSRGERVG